VPYPLFGRVPVAVAVAALLGVAACGRQDAVDAAPTEVTSAPPTTPESSAPTTDESSAPTTATSEPTTPATEPTTEPTKAPASGLAAALVPAADLPRNPSGRRWVAGTDARGPDAAMTSPCQRAPLMSIGATKVVQRRYDNRNPGNVVNTVAAFADDDSARRAYAVLEAWVRGCADTLREQGKKPLSTPSGFEPVDAGTSPAGWALLLYGPVRGDPDSAHIEGQTVVVDDETLSWVVYRSVGQDYNYEAGQSPPERAARVMAARLSTPD
jgi:predicted small lipoprotein YifL